MKGGQNRTPDEVKRLRGTDRKCRTNLAAPKVTVDKVPPVPKGMTKKQGEVWAELAEQVDDLGVYAKSNLTAFRLMVEVVTEARHPDPRDPATARVRLAQVAAGLLQRFGLDPGSRGRVSVVQKAKADETADFLFRGPLKVVK